MNIIRNMDEQVHSCTKWVDSIVGESYANSIRDGFYLGALVHLVNVIAGVSFNQNLFVHMLPLTFTAFVVKSVFIPFEKLHDQMRRLIIIVAFAGFSIFFIKWIVFKSK